MKKPLVVTLIFVLALTICACNTNNPNSPEALLAFDERAWNDYIKIETIYDNLLLAVQTYCNGDISEEDYRNQLTKLDKDFQNVLNSLDYAETEEELCYLEAIQDSATYYQSTTQGFINYLNSSDKADLLVATKSMHLGINNLSVISLEKEALLAKTGLSDEEMRKKINNDINVLPPKHALTCFIL